MRMNLNMKETCQNYSGVIQGQPLCFKNSYFCNAIKFTAKYAFECLLFVNSIFPRSPNLAWNLFIFKDSEKKCQAFLFLIKISGKIVISCSWYCVLVTKYFVLRHQNGNVSYISIEKIKYFHSKSAYGWIVSKVKASIVTIDWC